MSDNPPTKAEMIAIFASHLDRPGICRNKEDKMLTINLIRMYLRDIESSLEEEE